MPYRKSPARPWRQKTAGKKKSGAKSSDPFQDLVDDDRGDGESHMHIRAIYIHTHITHIHTAFSLFIIIHLLPSRIYAHTDITHIHTYSYVGDELDSDGDEDDSDNDSEEEGLEGMDDDEKGEWCVYVCVYTYECDSDVDDDPS